MTPNEKVKTVDEIVESAIKSVAWTTLTPVGGLSNIERLDKGGVEKLLKKTLTQRDKEIREEAYEAGKRYFLKNVSKLPPNGARAAYVSLDEVGEVDWDKLKALTNN